MRATTVIIVVAGLALAVALGVGRGFDATAVTILVSIVLVGAVAIAVANRAERGAIAPGRCDSCGGVVSARAPYCKHCGARRAVP
ncbi:MAG TPA: hypothetical protein VJ927_06120 [Actinomycetota bacterium]|nr:hypothetical protein [Actinomycetota bacterium]